MKRATALILLSFVCTTSAFQLVPSTTPDSVSSILEGRSGFAIIRDVDKRTLLVVGLPDLSVDTLATETNEVKYLRIAPDGRSVVYNVGGQMYIRELGDRSAERHSLGWGGRGTFWVNIETGDTSIVYSSMYEQSVLIDTTGTDSTKSPQYGGLTYRMRISGGQPSGGPVELLGQSFKAGLSRDGRWLGTADKSPMLFDRRERNLYQMTISKNSTCWPVMNPTADTAQMDQVAYLNTWHDTIVVKNSRDSVTFAMPFPQELWGPCVPATNQKWHSFAWSNHENFMFSGARLNRTVTWDTLATDQLFLAIIRRSDKKCLLLCTGGYHQDLWLEGAPEYNGPIVAVRRGVGQPSAAVVKTRGAFLTSGASSTASFANAKFDLRGARLPRSPGRKPHAAILAIGN